MTIQERVLKAMQEWDNERLRSELTIYISEESEDVLENLFFDDIATEEEKAEGKLFN